MTTPTDIPTRINRDEPDEAYLLGIRARDDVAVYWYVAAETVITVADGEQTVQEIPEATVEEHLLATDTDGGWRQLTDAGNFLRAAAPFHDERVLPHRQAAAYALRDILNVSRQRAAALLDISPNTVDNHRRTADDRLNNAAGLAAAAFDQ